MFKKPPLFFLLLPLPLFLLLLWQMAIICTTRKIVLAIFRMKKLRKLRWQKWAAGRQRMWNLTTAAPSQTILMWKCACQTGKNMKLK